MAIGEAVRKQPALHRVGSGAAVLCAVHCMALPVLATTMSLSQQSFLTHPLVELVLFGTAAVIGGTTLGAAYREHQKPAPLAMLGTGLALMILAHSLGHDTPGVIVTVAGSLLLVGAQLLNRRYAPVCCQDHPHPH